MLEAAGSTVPAGTQAVLLAGPTASGKSALALALALGRNGALINADSMQVYRDLHVLTARPALEDMRQRPHHLFGHVDGAVNYSVGHWLDEVRGLLPLLQAEGLLPIFVGGTGLYFKALTQGLSEIPQVPAAVRASVRAEMDGLPPEKLHQRLAACDPIMAGRLRPSDPQRLLRALEVFAATGQSLASFQTKKSPPLLDIDRCAALFLAPERGPLRERIAARFATMLQAGALDEVRGLAARGLDPRLPVMRAHGVPHLIAHLRGEIGVEAAADRAILDTWHYAKRQFTFARHQLPAFRMISPDEALP